MFLRGAKCFPPFHTVDRVFHFISTLVDLDRRLPSSFIQQYVCIRIKAKLPSPTKTWSIARTWYFVATGDLIVCQASPLSFLSTLDVLCSIYTPSRIYMYSNYFSVLFFYLKPNVFKNKNSKINSIKIHKYNILFKSILI